MNNMPNSDKVRDGGRFTPERIGVFIILILFVIIAAVFILPKGTLENLVGANAPAQAPQDQDWSCSTDNFKTRCSAVILGCFIVTTQTRGTFDVIGILQGEQRANIFLDITHQSRKSPYKVQGQINKTFSDTGEPYIHQYYLPSDLKAGDYILTIGYNNQAKSSQEVTIVDDAENLIYINCDSA